MELAVERRTVTLLDAQAVFLTAKENFSPLRKLISEISLTSPQMLKRRLPVVHVRG